MWKYILIFGIHLAIARTEGKYRFDYLYSKEAEGWLKVHRVPATFEDAFSRCHSEGAVLASPLTANIQKAMAMALDADGVDCAVYTGISATISKGDFVSVEGVPLDKITLEWALGEPDNYENQEDCIVMLQNGTVADARCNDTYPFLCFRKKTSRHMISVCGTVDPGYNLDVRTGNCYKLHNVGKTWQKAQSTCLAEGGHLAIINSPTEAVILKDLFAKAPISSIISPRRDLFSIGFLDRDKKGSWFTVNGQNLEDAGYASWGDQQPNNLDNNQYCGGSDETGLLNDVWCNMRLAFICEKTPDSLVSVEEEY